jgi:hypothetical protein
MGEKMRFQESDLVMATIVVFNSDESYSQNTLKEEHLDALKQFWQYIKQNPPYSNQASERVAFVLPKDYAYGFSRARR